MLHLSRGSRRLFAFSSALLVAIGLVAVFAAGGSAKQKRPPAHKPTRPGRGGRAHFNVVPWGSVNGASVFLWTLRNGRGMTVKITNYGATVQSILVPDRRGVVRDVALGFPTLADYVSDFTQGAKQTPWPLPGGSGNVFFGATIGRYANRIANHSFTMSCSGCSNNGVTYTLDANNGVNTLHGGYLGWNTVVWTGNVAVHGQDVSLTLTHDFPAGEGCTIPPSTSCTGFPAPVSATVVYTLTRNNALRIDYKAVNTAKDGAATVINLTNHTYFNLGGEASGSVYDQLLQINARRYQPVDTNLIPVGFAPVAGTAFDFRRLKPIGRDIRNPRPDNGGQPFPQLVITHGYDHNFVLEGSGYRMVALAEDPKDGIVLRTFTDQPGVQLYTGNFLVGDLIGTTGHTYRQSDAFTLETQHYPDSPHHIGQADWPSVVLNAGSTLSSTTTYQFSSGGRRR